MVFQHPSKDQDSKSLPIKSNNIFEAINKNVFVFVNITHNLHYYYY